jgi:hypothetical protein
MNDSLEVEFLYPIQPDDVEGLAKRKAILTTIGPKLTLVVALDYFVVIVIA